MLIYVHTCVYKLNYYSELMALKDQFGETLFYTIVLGLVCAACMKSGNACSHKLGLSPVRCVF